jgi:hypothetical protein
MVQCQLPEPDIIRVMNELSISKQEFRKIGIERVSLAPNLIQWATTDRYVKHTQIIVMLLRNTWDHDERVTGSIHADSKANNETASSKIVCERQILSRFPKQV